MEDLRLKSLATPIALVMVSLGNSLSTWLIIWFLVPCRHLSFITIIIASKEKYFTQLDSFYSICFWRRKTISKTNNCRKGSTWDSLSQEEQNLNLSGRQPSQDHTAYSGTHMWSAVFYWVGSKPLACKQSCTPVASNQRILLVFPEFIQKVKR